MKFILESHRHDCYMNSPGLVWKWGQSTCLCDKICILTSYSMKPRGLGSFMFQDNANTPIFPLVDSVTVWKVIDSYEIKTVIL